MAENKPKKVRDRKREVQKRTIKKALQVHLAQDTGESPTQEQQSLVQMQVELRLLEKRTRGNPTDADADIDFAYRNMASPTVTPLIAPSTSAWSWYIYSRTEPNKFLEICAKREDAKSKMAGTITNQRMIDDRRNQFAVIDQMEKQLTLDVDGIVTELMQKFPGDVRRVVAKFDPPAEQR